MIESIDVDEWLGLLASAVGRLAAPAHTQSAYLAQLGSIDELGLEFDDYFLPLESVMERKALQEGDQRWAAALHCLRSLSAELESDDLQWTDEALRESPSWDAVRAMAAAAGRSLENAARS